MRQTSRLRVLEGLGMVVLRPCLRPVRVNRVERAGLGGRAHLAMEPRSVAAVDLGVLFQSRRTICARHGGMLKPRVLQVQIAPLCYCSTHGLPRASDSLSDELQASEERGRGCMPPGYWLSLTFRL